ncbi:hypothetical protein [Clostridium cylindrosporum]|uniref:Uncharacterized protein n=1 Tax=Clostridium cylindrosporum DSM 605 TaxID=1121307 RepID=A0A0J8DBK0_CLOCY|nr:hypothetical protein [Clostridium cylindrosporum]KMT23222.1 hypothetical protein CLCY_6c01030 [Clostridium cylindrosporum DSM 605]
MNALLSISEEEFNQKVEIRFESIIDGLNNYNNAVLEPKEVKDLCLIEEDFIGFIKDIYRTSKSNKENLIVDLYLPRLTNGEFENLYNALNEEDKIILMKIRNCRLNSNYFMVMDEEIIGFLVRLCTRELFFITFYFFKCPLTIWGNYNLKFPIFYMTEDDIKTYSNLIDKHNLKLS